MSLKVQGSTAVKHLRKHLLQFGGQMDNSNYLQGLLECFQPWCQLGSPQEIPSHFASWHALTLNLWDSFNQLVKDLFLVNKKQECE